MKIFAILVLATVVVSQPNFGNQQYPGMQALMQQAEQQRQMAVQIQQQAHAKAQAQIQNAFMQMGQPPMGQPPMVQLPMGQPLMGQPQMGQPPMGQPPMSQPPMGQPPMGHPPTGQPSMKQPQMSQPPMSYGLEGLQKQQESLEKQWENGELSNEEFQQQYNQLTNLQIEQMQGQTNQ